MNPRIRRWRTGGLGSLGQFDEAALAQKQAQLMQLRNERAGLEAELQSVKTGIPIKRQPAASEIPSAEGAFSAVSSVPTWVWLAAAGAGALFLLRGRKAAAQ